MVSPKGSQTAKNSGSTKATKTGSLTGTHSGFVTENYSDWYLGSSTAICSGTATERRWATAMALLLGPELGTK